MQSPQAAQLREEHEVEQLARERMGVQFLHRVTRDDLGLEVTVIELDPSRPKQRVIVRYEPMPGRPSTPYDRPLDQRVSVEWRSLTEPDAAQRHRTARLIEQSYDDGDGWIEYERLDNSGSESAGTATAA